MLKQRIEQEQFEPSLLGIFVNPFYIARKGLLKSIASLGNNITGKTLDVGCGTKPYEKYFHSSQYIGLEIETTLNRERKKADVFYDGSTFPFKNEEFDSVVTNQVFEHVFNPSDFLNEINRVLKKDGVLLLTVPFVWDEHEQPYDFARYSSFGIRHVLEQHGFTVQQHLKSVNDVRVIAQLMNGYLYKKTFHNKLLRQFVTLTVMSLITIVASFFAVILPANDDLYLDNIVLARKVKNV
ncbi:MAG: class I SAM-dependent methyltransferase [Bacteroidota bacterium]